MRIIEKFIVIVRTRFNVEQNIERIDTISLMTIEHIIEMFRLSSMCKQRYFTRTAMLPLHI
jgi:hypothetical protein